MKRVFVVFFAVSVALYMFGLIVDWRVYFQNLQNIPSLMDSFKRVGQAAQDIGELPSKFDWTVYDFASFFQVIGNFFQFIGLLWLDLAKILVLFPVEFIMWGWQSIYYLIPWPSWNDGDTIVRSLVIL